MDYNQEYQNLEKEGIIIHSPSMLQIYQKAELLARTSVSVLIYGESGTGKNQLASYIRQKSALAQAPFIRINCNAISPELFASELFGYTPNAFTGASARGKIGLLEAANHGTVLFDEINELSAQNQTLLLHFLQNRTITPIGSLKTKEIHTHILCTSGQNLQELIHQGTFRSDLYYRICVASIYVPPLRERREEIPYLLRHYIQSFAADYHLAVEKLLISDDQMVQLSQLDWPGNIREIQNLAQRICFAENPAQAMETYILQSKSISSLPAPFSSPHPASNTVTTNHRPFPIPPEMPAMPLKKAVHEFEHAYIQHVINQSDSLQAAAVLLDISFSTLCRKKSEYGIYGNRKK